MSEHTGLNRDVSFEYAPLPSRFVREDGTGWFRIMALAPARNFNDTLYGIIAYANFYDPTHFEHFEALSYVWGDQRDSRTIYCQNFDYSGVLPEEPPADNTWRPLKITANLDRALRYLRFKTENRLLYIDAICINQDDIQEKEFQIRLLSRIYANSSRTIIWIGEADSDTPYVFWIMTTLAWVEKKVRWLKMIVSWERLTAWFRWCFPRFDRAWRKLCDRPWFHRLWTLQECLLAREWLLVCGNHSVSKTAFAVSKLWISAPNKSVFALQSSKNGHTGRLDALYAYASAMQKDAHPLERRADIVSLLIESKQLLASNTKDKVIGTIALAQTLEMALPNLTYDMTEVQIFSAATRSWIKYLQCINCLGIAVTPRNTKTLPSWAIDWGHQAWQDYGYLATCFAAAHPGGDIRFVGFESASKKAVYVAHEAEHDTDVRLWLRGILLADNIVMAHTSTSSGTPLEPHLSRDSEAEETFKNALRHMLPVQIWLMFLYSIETTRSAERPLAQLAPILLLLRHHTNIDDVDRMEQSLEQLVQCAIEICQTGSSQSNEVSIIKAAMENLAERGMALAAILTAVGYQMMSIFLTANGRVGVCFGTNVEPGSLIALVAGWDFPVILGPTETQGEYTLLGPAYIHSLMDGHAWPSDEGDLADIVLV